MVRVQGVAATAVAAAAAEVSPFLVLRFWHTCRAISRFPTMACYGGWPRTVLQQAVPGCRHGCVMVLLFSSMRYAVKIPGIYG